MKHVLYSLIILGILVTTARTQGTWTKPISGTTKDLNGIFFINTSVGWACGASGTILKTVDGGTTWVPLTSGVGWTLYSIHFVNENYGWCGGNNDCLLTTTDGGGTWTPTTWSSTGNTFTHIVMTTPTTVWFTADDGYTTTYVYRSLNSAQYTQRTTSSLPSHIFFVDSSNGWVVGGSSTVKKTTDGGATWSFITAGNIDRPRGVHFVDNLTGYLVGYSGTAVKTTNGGTAWSNLTTGTTALGWADISFANENIGYIVGSPGMRQTTDGGGSWGAVTMPATNSLKAIQCIGTDNGWAVGTSGTIFKYSTSSTHVTAQSSVQPAGFALEQNYPNPFNPSTMISFTIRSRAWTDLAVYDLLGRKVASLVDAELEEGSHVVSWDASSVSSGTYIYSLSSGNKTTARTMILQK